MKQVFVSDKEGERITGLDVTISYARKRAPYKRFKLLNLNREVPLTSLTGLQAKVLLVLLFSQTALTTKEIAALVKATSAATCRALTGLAVQGLVVKVSRGVYQVNPDLAYYGRWTSQNTQHPQSQHETQ